MVDDHNILRDVVIRDILVPSPLIFGSLKKLLSNFSYIVCKYFSPLVFYSKEEAMEGCLLIGGKAPSKKDMEGLFRPWDVVVAADSGLSHAASLGLYPDEIIGDFDSVSPELLEQYPDLIQHRHKRDKDETDTELGIDLLRDRGADTIHVIGGGGGRLDHLYAIISLFHRDNPPDHWYTHREHISLISGTADIKTVPGRRLSFFPVGMQTAEMSTEGLKWPLDRLSWKPGDFGISNIALDDHIEIKMKSGRLIMIYDLGPEDRQ